MFLNKSCDYARIENGIATYTFKILYEKKSVLLFLFLFIFNKTRVYITVIKNLLFYGRSFKVLDTRNILILQSINSFICLNVFIHINI